MELHQLRYFAALAQELSFTRAAARVFVSQQALSQAIAALERQVGATLVIRRPRGCSLTPAGERLAEIARDLVRQVDQVSGRLVPVNGGPLRLGVLLDGLGPFTVPIVHAYRAAMGDGSVAISRIHPEQVTPWLLGERIDVAFTHGPSDPRLTALPIFAERRVVAISVRHDLADAEVAQTNDLLELPARTRRPDIDPEWEGVFTLIAERGAEQPPRFGEPVGSLEELLWSIAVDGAFLTMPAHLAHVYRGEQFGIRYVPVPDLTPVEFCVLHRAGSRDRRIHELIQITRSTVAALRDLLPDGNPQAELVGPDAGAMAKLDPWHTAASTFRS